ncbi:MAG: hypothetical protein ACH346_02485 [Chthoniobacterales bacterium]
MTPTLKELLTQELLDDGKPLFATAAALGKAIIAQKKNEYTSARSVSTLIGFIFCGKRSCPKSLRELILKATRARLDKKPERVQNEWAQRIEKAIDLLDDEVNKANETRSELDEDQFDSLLEHAESAKKHFIITPLTAEQERGIKRADELNYKLLRRLGIYPKNEVLPTTEYWFLLPNPKTGERFWEKLREKSLLALDGTADASWADKRIKFLEKNNYIQVYIVPSFVCGCPIVVYDPDSTRDTAGFSFSHHRDNVIDTIRWDGVSLSQWKENVFERFQWQDPKTGKSFEQELDSIDFMKKNLLNFAGYRCPYSY